MSDVAKLAAVFRAAADGVASPEMAEFDSGTRYADMPADISRAAFVRSQMARRVNNDPIVAASWLAYDGVARMFEALLAVPSAPQVEAAGELKTVAYLVRYENGLSYATTNRGSADRYAQANNGRVVELVERPTAQNAEATEL